MDFQPQVRIVMAMLAALADACATFDNELDDPNSGSVYKAAIRARIKTRLQNADTALQAIIAQL